MVKRDVKPLVSSFKPAPGKSALVVTKMWNAPADMVPNNVYTYLDTEFIGSNKGSSYFAKADISPGIRHIIVTNNGSHVEAIQINFEKDKTYYLHQALFPCGMGHCVALYTPNPKWLDGEVSQGEGIYYEYDFAQKSEYQNLPESEYKQYIKNAQIMFVNKDGENELRTRTPDDH